jgi:hypothetical protein
MGALMTDARAVFGKLAASLVGQRIAFTRVAGNSLLLYVGLEPGGPDTTGVVTWFNPPWQVSSPNGVILGSYPVSAASHESREVFDSACAPAELLRGQPIASLVVDDRTSELTLSAGEFVVRSFVDDPDDGELWQVHDRASGARVYGGGPGLKLE